MDADALRRAEDLWREHSVEERALLREYVLTRNASIDGGILDIFDHAETVGIAGARREELSDAVAGSLAVGRVDLSLLLSLLDIEPEKVDQWMYVQESLAALRERGYERHLTSLEAFSAIFDAEDNPSTSTYRALSADMRRGLGEWLHDAFMKRGGVLYAAFGVPFRRNRDGLDYVVDGNLPGPVVEYDFPVHGSRDDPNFYPITDLPEKFVLDRWGRKADSVQSLSGHASGLLVVSDGVWRPVARGYGNDNDFSLIADYFPRASRGVRRKGA
jgi:hypothetical protein